MEQILIKGFPVNYNELEITYENAEIINKKIAIENLKIFSKIAFENKLKYYLSYGTLLGAIRNKDLIDYDIDVDVSVFNEMHFLSLINQFEKYGFTLVRYEEGISYTIMKGSVYIDIYILNPIPVFSKSDGRSVLIRLMEHLFFYKECNRLIPKIFSSFTKRITVSKIKVQVPVFSNMFLHYIYGPTWRIPQKGVPGYGALGLKEGFRRIFNSIVGDVFNFSSKGNH